MKILGIGEMAEFFMLLKEHVGAIKLLSLVTTCNEETLSRIYRHARDAMELIKEYEEKMGFIKEYEGMKRKKKNLNWVPIEKIILNKQKLADLEKMFKQIKEVKE